MDGWTDRWTAGWMHGWLGEGEARRASGCSSKPARLAVHPGIPPRPLGPGAHERCAPGLSERDREPHQAAPPVATAPPVLCRRPCADETGAEADGRLGTAEAGSWPAGRGEARRRSGAGADEPQATKASVSDSRLSLRLESFFVSCSDSRRLGRWRGTTALV
ncbi:hypothetical protein CDD83_205 [Cordyceps sp. RAO-2017]|nr:hypothetical protein CDD83_205 [Cordyceps sp. RAO-2017]